MMKRSHAALAAALSLLAISPAVADYSFQAGGATVTQGATVVGGKSRSHFILYDAAGNPALTTGNPGFFSLSGGIPAGTNAIGTVGVTALPPLPAGTNSIGSVTVTGGATAAKQPAPGTAGTPSVDVLSVQGVANGAALPVDTIVRSNSTDRGGTVTAGGTAQQFMAANTSRRGYLFQNQSTGDLYVNCLTTAAANQTSLRIPPNALYETGPHHAGTGACSVFGATTAQAFYAREF